MYKYLKKIISILIKSKKNIFPPKKNNILIFDQEGSDNIINFFKKNINSNIPEILSVRGECINLSILFICLLKFKIKKNFYIQEYIKNVNPLFVITFIDNNFIFYKIHQQFPNIKFIFIQNGWRSYYNDIFEKLENISNSKKIHKVDTMLVFGRSIGNLYSKYTTGEVKVIGSLKNNFNLKTNNKKNKKNRLLVFISQWIEEEFEMNNCNYNNLNYSYPCDKIILPALSKFTDKNKYDLYILTRSVYGSNAENAEKYYFNSNFDFKINFFNKAEFKNSYEIIDFADLVTGIDSTLLYESLSRNNKTAFFSFRGKILNLKGFDFGWPTNFDTQGSFWTNTPDVNKIIQILEFLEKNNLENLKKIYKSLDMEKLMIFDENNKILTKFLKDQIENK